MKVDVIEYQNRIEHYLNKRSHRVNGPAIIYFDGEETWMFDGRFHRYYGYQNNYNQASWWIHGKWVRDAVPGLK